MGELEEKAHKVIAVTNTSKDFFGMHFQEGGQALADL